MNAAVEAKPKLVIDYVSDVVCPWCAIGLASLDRALEKLAPEIDIAISFQPFELNPDMVPEGEVIAEHLARKYGGSPEQFAASFQAIRERGAAVGFAFGERSPAARVYNTFDAHRLLWWAGAQGRQSALKHELLAAYHGRGEDVSNREVLIDAAGFVGLDTARAAQVLDSGEFGTDVRKAEIEWQRAGISGVPAIVINRRHLITGGQPPEVFERALRQIAAEAAWQADGS